MALAEQDGRRVRGDATRQRILALSTEVATVDGLGGLSLAHLADALQLSKSGVHALFGTKEELQLATLGAARKRFIAVVINPVLDQPEGLPRLRGLTASWIEYVRRREFPGGCFITRWTSEFATHPGRVRDALSAMHTEWLGLLARQLTVAQEQGDIGPDVDPEQLAFEIEGLLAAGNTGALMGDDEALDRAACGVEARIRFIVAA